MSNEFVKPNGISAHVLETAQTRKRATNWWLIIVAALSIGEFQFSNLVAGFLNRTYPVVLLQAFFGATGFACAATVILLTLAVVAAIAGSVTAGGATRLKTVVT